jgi:hypothetical protein
MAKLREPTTNDIVRLHSLKKKPPKLTMTKLNRDTILIEGDAPALEFLGQFILAHSQADKFPSCKISLHPKSAGSIWFTRDSTLGFYLHKLPCSEGSILDKKASKKRKVK